ncbi:Hypothetical protein Minf_0097 [Methylacidiphilum infernorum V4]|uniref:Uncharacterized protein n=1 Tax=Methylacidiphilum infernorum (isolate V4) TaxID=481448 RepID=B3DX17_METI4|nr:Hypothetical protein Minf_0097 [Methylacidiphilum infernorum V4]
MASTANLLKHFSYHFLSIPRLVQENCLIPFFNFLFLSKWFNITIKSFSMKFLENETLIKTIQKKEGGNL